MPIMPGPLVELAGFGMNQNITKNIVTKNGCHRLDVIVVADVHDLSYNALRFSHGNIRRLPPYVLLRQASELKVNLCSRFSRFGVIHPHMIPQTKSGVFVTEIARTSDLP